MREGAMKNRANRSPLATNECDECAYTQNHDSDYANWGEKSGFSQIYERMYIVYLRVASNTKPLQTHKCILWDAGLFWWVK